MDNLVAIGTKDALLVANRDNVNQVKGIVAQLSNLNRTEHWVVVIGCAIIQIGKDNVTLFGYINELS